MDADTSRLGADVYNAQELIPWIRAFICRVIQVHFLNPDLERQFKKDLREMYRLYGLAGGHFRSPNTDVSTLC